MSSKINVFQIIISHFSTLKNANTEKASRGDIITFFIFPLSISALCLYTKTDISKDAINLIVTSGSILTGLLLNLLFLVYDQKSKLEKVDMNNSEWISIQERHNALQELYYNISYSTIISLFIVAISTTHILLIEYIFKKTFFENQKYHIDVNLDVSEIITSPIIIFLGINLMMTILMIIKRVYKLLTTI